MHARPPDAVESLRARSAEARHGLYVGEGAGGPAFAAPQRGLLVLGPPRSGKTSAIVVPNVLAAAGPVVAASTKPDVVHLTAAARSTAGPCFLFDPTGTVGPIPHVRRIGWSPLSGASSFEHACLVAESMVRASRPESGHGDARHWSERAEALLSVLFHAGAMGGLSFTEVVSAVDCREVDELRACLARRSADRPLDVLRSITATEGREQSGIWSTASSVLGCYRSTTALSSTSGDLLEASRFVAGPATLYICAGSDRQRLVAPVVAGVVRDLRTAAYDRSAALAPAGEPGRPPLLLALDEVANIAPLHDLPSLVAEGAGQGVVTLACLQDLSQAASRWGPHAAAGFLSLFGTKLVLPGIGDTATLEALSRLVGEVDVPTTSTTRTPPFQAFLTGRYQSSRTTGLRRERRLPLDAIARGRPGTALLMEGVQPSLVRAVPWFASRELAAALRGQEPRPPNERGRFLSRGPRGGRDRAP
jgi:type IV secretion system protein VirD4